MCGGGVMGMWGCWGMGCVVGRWRMCVCVGIYVCVMGVGACIGSYVCEWIHVCERVWMHICMDVYMCACVHLYRYISVYVYV